jgi:hypothetical protein
VSFKESFFDFAETELVFDVVVVEDFTEEVWVLDSVALFVEETEVLTELVKDDFELEADAESLVLVLSFEGFEIVDVLLEIVIGEEDLIVVFGAEEVVFSVLLD